MTALHTGSGVGEEVSNTFTNTPGGGVAENFDCFGGASIVIGAMEGDGEEEGEGADAATELGGM